MFADQGQERKLMFAGFDGLANLSVKKAGTALPVAAASFQDPVLSEHKAHLFIAFVKAGSRKAAERRRPLILIPDIFPGVSNIDLKVLQFTPLQELLRFFTGCSINLHAFFKAVILEIPVGLHVEGAGSGSPLVLLLLFKLFKFLPLQLQECAGHPDAGRNCRGALFLCSSSLLS